MAGFLCHFSLHNSYLDVFLCRQTWHFPVLQLFKAFIAKLKCFNCQNLNWLCGNKVVKCASVKKNTFFFKKEDQRIEGKLFFYFFFHIDNNHSCTKSIDIELLCTQFHAAIENEVVFFSRIFTVDFSCLFHFRLFLVK